MSPSVGIGKGVFADKNVGTGKAVTVSGYTLSGADAGNYTLIEPTGLTANVAARSLTVSAIASNKVYDGSTDAAVTLGDNRIAGDVLATGYTLAAFTDANAGTGKTVSVSGIALSGVDAGNYNFNTAAATTASITPAPLTVAANNASKAYDGIAYSGGSGVTYTGFVAGQSAGSLSGSLMYGGTSQGAINVGNYTIIPGGLSSGNYAITFVNGVLTVAPAVLTIAANETSKVIAATAYGDSMAGQATASSNGTSPYDDSSQRAVSTSTYTLISGGLPSDTNSIGYIDGILTITPDGNEIH